MKAHVRCNLNVPHPTLIALGISAAISAVILGIFYMAETGVFGQDAAEAAYKNGRIRRS